MKSSAAVFATLIALLLVASGCGAGSSGDQITLRLAHSGSDTHQYQIASKKFSELVDEKTDGAITVDIFNNAKLGSEAEVIEQVIGGSVDMTTVAADSSFSNTVPAMNLFAAPYLFEDRDHVYTVLDGEVGQELLDIVNDNGMIGLGYWEIGFRHLTNNQREVIEPEDTRGLKIRVQPSPIWEEHMKAIGASPTPIDFNELYSAMDQGVVDGQENPLATIDSMNFYEVQDFVSLTGHTYTPAIVVMSESAGEQLDEDQMNAVEEAVEEATTYQREELTEGEEQILNELEDAGLTISEPNREAFQEATEQVREEVIGSDVPPEIFEKIEAAKASNK